MIQCTVYNSKERMMLKPCTYTLAAIAVIFSLTAYGADPVTEKSGTPSVPESQEILIGEEMASNPAKFLQAAAQADNMGYVFAVVYNPTSVAVANVYVRVVHFDAETRQPDGQSDSLLVAANLAPKQRGQLKLEGARVYKPADLKLYRVIVERAELAR
jgi:hypothetical protein